MSIFSRFINGFKALGSSQAEIRALIAQDTFGGFSSATYQQMARHYVEISLVHFITNDIATSAASIPLDFENAPPWVEELMNEPEKATDHAPGLMYNKWMYKGSSFKRLSGSFHAEAQEIGSQVKDLTVIRPDRIAPEEDSDEILTGWQITRGGRMKTVEPKDVFVSHHLHPLLDNFGNSPMQACNADIAQRSEVARLNMSILKNDGEHYFPVRPFM